MVNRYGTTSDMIIQEIDDNGSLKLIAIDAKGLYLTTRDRVDRMVADVNRYGVPRDEVYNRMKILGVDPKKLFGANRHLIKIQAGEKTGPKLNPIKASKRRV